MGGSFYVHHPPESPSQLSVAQRLPCRQLPLPCPTPEEELYGPPLAPCHVLLSEGAASAGVLDSCWRLRESQLLSSRVRPW